MKKPSPHTKTFLKKETSVPMFWFRLALGSTPQQVPFVPFEGKMVQTPEGSAIDFEIPDKFRIETPTAYEQIPEADFESYTEVGWQLGMPRSLAYTAWDKAEETNPEAGRVYDQITKLVENRDGNLESEKLRGMIENSLKWALQNQYEMMSNAEIRGRTFHFELDIPGIENKIERSVKLEEETFKRLLKLLPRNLIARSENGLAGIITYDKYFVPEKGYRSVYFSPEIGASPSQTAGEIIRNAVEWTQEWKPLRDRLLVFLENMPVHENLKHSFTDKLSEIEGEKVMEKGLILNENGKNILQFSAEGENKVHILAAHPTSEEINCEIKGKAHVDSKTTADKITNLTIQIEAKGTIKVELSAEKASSILNPVFTTIIGRGIERIRRATKQIAVEKTEDLPKKITLPGGLFLTIGNVTPDTPVNFEIENSKIEGLKIAINRSIDNMEVSIEKLKERPSETPEPPGLVHGYINISSNMPEDAIENSNITFKVSKEWLNTHSLPEENVSLLRYHEGRWENLSSELIGENATHFKYLARTPGFSTFAITSGTREEVSPPQFEMNNLSIDKEKIEPGESVSASVDVTNVGGERGTHTVRLEIDGETRTKELTLEPNSTDTITFRIVKNEEGTHTVRVGEMTSSFEVVKSEETGEEQEPEEGLPLIPIGITTVIVVIIAIFFLYKRR